jgi:vacuolar protein sorting-associated protein 29
MQGSITGAFSPLTDDVTPSFVLLAVQDTKIVCYVYELTPEGEVDVSKTEFTKQRSQQEVAPPSANPALLESLLK